MAGVAVIVTSAFLPWGGSGRAERDSFEIVAVASRLGVVSDRVETLAKAWFAAPLAGATALLAAAAGRRRITEAAGTALAVGGVGLAVAVATSPLRPLAGVYATIVGGLLVGAGLVVGRIERSRKERTR